MIKQNEPSLTPRQALAQTLDDCQPDTLLVCGTLPVRLGRAWHEQYPDRLYTELFLSALNNGLPPADTHDLALIEGALEQLSHEEGTLMLGQLRNFGTHRIAVIMTNESGWQLSDFLGLGFKRQAHLQGTPARTLYTYNIDSYNRRRDWNNPQYWANPEMWDKARW
ncbi:DUF6231 family protein [Marinobacter sp.]|uniref:DUF6231 family protein n=1 Tax=Marinobacter sp. TaxID=50741 RepID=UPI003A92A1C1